MNTAEIPTPLTAVVIDDEARARRVLTSFLTDFCEGVTVVAQCADVPAAVLEINRHRPDLVFCDIEMPNYSGLQLLDFFRQPDFELIFATGYSEYAARAFELSAVDYLLKPIQIDKLQRSVMRVRERLELHSMAERLASLRENIDTDVPHRIALPVRDGLIFHDIDDLVLLGADGAYTQVHLRDGSVQMVSKKLRFFEDFLGNNPQFYRVHRSAMVNVNFIERYSRHDSTLALVHGWSAPVARQQKTPFETFIRDMRL